MEIVRWSGHPLKPNSRASARREKTIVYVPSGFGRACVSVLFRLVRSISNTASRILDAEL